MTSWSRGWVISQWAKILGAKSVTVFDVNDNRLSLARKLGADFIVNSKIEQSANDSFDFIFETAGQSATILKAFDLASNKATVCFIGTPHTEVVFSASQWEKLNRKELTLTGSWMSYSASFPGEEWLLTAHYFKTGQLKYDSSLIYKKYPLSQIKQAFMNYKDPKGVGGKVLIIND